MEGLGVVPNYVHVSVFLFSFPFSLTTILWCQLGLEKIGYVRLTDPKLISWLNKDDPEATCGSMLFSATTETSALAFPPPITACSFKIFLVFLLYFEGKAEMAWEGNPKTQLHLRHLWVWQRAALKSSGNHIKSGCRLIGMVPGCIWGPPSLLPIKWGNNPQTSVEAACASSDLEGNACLSVVQRACFGAARTGT